MQQNNKCILISELLDQMNTNNLRKLQNAITYTSNYYPQSQKKFLELPQKNNQHHNTLPQDIYVPQYEYNKNNKIQENLIVHDKNNIFQYVPQEKYIREQNNISSQNVNAYKITSNNPNFVQIPKPQKKIDQRNLIKNNKPLMQQQKDNQYMNSPSNPNMKPQKNIPYHMINKIVDNIQKNIQPQKKVDIKPQNNIPYHMINKIVDNTQKNIQPQKKVDIKPQNNIPYHMINKIVDNKQKNTHHQKDEFRQIHQHKNNQNQKSPKQIKFQQHKHRDQIIKVPQNPSDSKSNLKLKRNIEEAIVTQRPNVRWDDIVGLQNAKNALKQAVILPIKHPQIFTGARKTWKGILLYGPPGTGKTFLAKACATQAKTTFFAVSSSDLMSKYVGESEKLIKTLFNLARQKKPSIIFIDEIDSMCGNRTDGQNQASRRVKTQFLVQMQGVGKDDQGILVLAATNIPESLDPAMRRRFQKRIYISLPQKQARFNMLIKGMKNNTHELTEADFRYFAQKTENFSGSDIQNLIQDAVYQPVRFFQQTQKFRILKNGKYLPVAQNYQGSDVVRMNWQQIPSGKLQIPPVVFKSFEKSLKRAKATVSQTQLKKYEEFTLQFGQQG